MKKPKETSGYSSEEAKESILLLLFNLNNFVLIVDEILINPYNIFIMRLKKAIIETAKRAVKENDREMIIALMNRYPNSNELWSILFPKGGEKHAK